MTPYRNNGYLTPQRIQYNKSISRIRIRSEHCLALLQNRWRILLDKMDVRKIWKISFYINACAILHNICLTPCENLGFPNIQAAYNQNIGALYPTHLQRQLGAQKRNNIRNNLNAGPPNN